MSDILSRIDEFIESNNPHEDIKINPARLVQKGNAVYLVDDSPEDEIEAAVNYNYKQLFKELTQEANLTDLHPSISEKGISFENYGEKFSVDFSPRTTEYKIHYEFDNPEITDAEEAFEAYENSTIDVEGEGWNNMIDALISTQLSGFYDMDAEKFYLPEANKPIEESQEKEDSTICKVCGKKIPKGRKGCCCDKCKELDEKICKSDRDLNKNDKVKIEESLVNTFVVFNTVSNTIVSLCKTFLKAKDQASSFNAVTNSEKFVGLPFTTVRNREYSFSRELLDTICNKLAERKVNKDSKLQEDDRKTYRYYFCDNNASASRGWEPNHFEEYTKVFRSDLAALRYAYAVVQGYKSWKELVEEEGEDYNNLSEDDFYTMLTASDHTDGRPFFFLIKQNQRILLDDESEMWLEHRADNDETWY